MAHPEVFAKAAAVCRLYLAQPEGAVVLSIDEKTAIATRSPNHPTTSPRLGATDPIDLLAWIAQAHHDLHTAEQVLAAAAPGPVNTNTPGQPSATPCTSAAKPPTNATGPPAATPEGRTP